MEEQSITHERNNNPPAKILSIQIMGMDGNRYRIWLDPRGKLGELKITPTTREEPTLEEYTTIPLLQAEFSDKKSIIQKTIDRLEGLGITKKGEGSRLYYKLEQKNKLNQEEYNKTIEEASEQIDIDELLNGQNNLKKIRSPLDFVKGKPYLGVVLPMRVEDEITNKHIYITNARAITTTEELEQEGLMMTGEYPDGPYPGQMSNDSIHKYLKGQWLQNPYDNAELKLPENIVDFITKSTFRHLMELVTEEQYDFCTLYCIATYFYPIFQAFPYGYIGGEYGSGKTKLGQIITHLSFNGFASMNISEAALFRFTENIGGTVVIDEYENLAHPKPGTREAELRQLLNGSYKQGNPVVRIEKIGEKFITREFNVYGPRVIINISGLDDVLLSRCIPITLLRAYSNDVKGKRSVNEDSGIWTLCRDLSHFFLLRYYAIVESVAYFLALPTINYCEDVKVVKKDGLPPSNFEITDTTIQECHISENSNPLTLPLHNLQTFTVCMEELHSSVMNLNSANLISYNNLTEQQRNDIKKIHELKQKISPREWELWFPIFTVAVVSNKVDSMLKYCEQVVSERKDVTSEESEAKLVIMTIDRILQDVGYDTKSTVEVLIPYKKIKEQIIAKKVAESGDDEKFVRSEMKWLTPYVMKKYLNRFAIRKSRHSRDGNGPVVCRMMIDEVIVRYNLRYVDEETVIPDCSSHVHEDVPSSSPGGFMSSDAGESMSDDKHVLPVRNDLTGGSSVSERALLVRVIEDFGGDEFSFTDVLAQSGLSVDKLEFLLKYYVDSGFIFEPRKGVFKEMK